MVNVTAPPLTLLLNHTTTITPIKVNSTSLTITTLLLQLLLLYIRHVTLLGMPKQHSHPLHLHHKYSLVLCVTPTGLCKQAHREKQCSYMRGSSGYVCKPMGGCGGSDFALLVTILITNCKSDIQISNDYYY